MYSVRNYSLPLVIDQTFKYAFLHVQYDQAQMTFDHNNYSKKTTACRILTCICIVWSLSMNNTFERMLLVKGKSDTHSKLISAWPLHCEKNCSYSVWDCEHL